MTIDLLAANLLSPGVLAFALGILARGLKSDLELPKQLYESLSIYLLFAIGLKGGLALHAGFGGDMLGPVAATVVLGVAIPLWCFPLLTRLAGFNAADAAALAAHYGSVSAVTFMAALAFVEASGDSAEPFLPALVALMEAPAILVAVLLARRSGSSGSAFGPVLRETLAGRSILLLLGGMGIGVVAGPERAAPLAPVFVTAFPAALTFFLLEMGLLVGPRLAEAIRSGPRLLIFAIAAPLVHGALGCALGTLVGMTTGGAMILGTMTASASYIAAPAAVRHAIPEARPGIYLGAALGVTFPFNLAIGIPLYHALARFLARVGSS